MMLNRDNSENTSNELLDSLLEGFQIIGHDWTYLFLNKAAAEHGRMAREDMIGHTMMELYPGIEQTEMFRLLSRCMTDRTRQRMENEFTYPDGKIGWFELRFQPVPQGVSILSLDISDQKQAEANVKQYSKRLELLAEVVRDLSSARSVAEIASIVRVAARALVNSDGATFVLRDGDLCHYFDEDAISPLWKGQRFPMTSCISGWSMFHGEPAVIEDIYIDDRIPHDAYRPTFVKSLVMVPIRSADPIGAIGNYWANQYHATDQDVQILQALADSTSVAMENVRAYESLAQSEARNRAICDHLPYPTILWECSEDNISSIALNREAKELVQNSDEGTLGLAPDQLLPEISNITPDILTCFERHSSIIKEIDFRAIQKQAPKRIVVNYGFIPPDKVLLQIEDVTGQRKLEEQLRISQKMDAVGRLAGGVAHDFNNLLTIINGYSDLATTMVRKDDPIHPYLKEISDAGDRASALTRQLMVFSRNQNVTHRVLNLNSVVSGMERMLKRLIREDILIQFDLASELGNIEADSGQLEQVIMNLIINARDAMPKGGKLTIESTNMILDEHFTAQHLIVKPGPYVLLAVSDTGHGMDAETQSRIFEPFFTTKSSGQGTGLGLATVYSIVKQSGGSIWVYSELGQGTTFKLYFPSVEGDAVGVAEAARALTITKNGETILVVEDDEALRKLASQILTNSGYRVLTAASGEAAIEICMKNQESIALILTDIVMPGMSGSDLVAKLSEKFPALKVLFMSGYTDDALVRHGVLDGEAQFIGKPFSGADLTRKVREVLGH